MTKKILVCVSFLALVSCLCAIISTTAIFKQIITVVGTMEDNDAQVLFAQLDNIEKGMVSTQSYYLEGGSTYMVVAIGDGERLTDIDLQVLDSDEDLVGEDKDDSNVAVVSVSPSYGEKFYFRVSAYAMDSNDAFYGIVVCRTD